MPQNILDPETGRMRKVSDDEFKAIVASEESKARLQGPDSGSSELKFVDDKGDGGDGKLNPSVEKAILEREEKQKSHAYTNEELEALTMVELRQICELRQIPFDKKAKKPELIKTILPDDL